MGDKREYYLIPDYQWVVGPLTEFDPNSVLRELAQDINGVANSVIGFLSNQDIGELKWTLNNTFDYVSRELNSRGVILDTQEACTYGKYISMLASGYLSIVSVQPYWLTRHATWVAGQYSKADPTSVEFLLDFNTVKVPEFDTPDTYQAIQSEATALAQQLVTGMGGAL